MAAWICAGRSIFRAAARTQSTTSIFIDIHGQLVATSQSVVMACLITGAEDNAKMWDAMSPRFARPDSVKSSKTRLCNASKTISTPSFVASGTMVSNAALRTSSSELFRTLRTNHSTALEAVASSCVSFLSRMAPTALTNSGLTIQSSGAKSRSNAGRTLVRMMCSGRAVQISARCITKELRNFGSVSVYATARMPSMTLS
mmetsp:Transcript_88990/g.256555  ORF Transcript_88990/g.256555 Transcript_88990/m.256555 type:complete len:201 (-) Transcript_88990:976-1578(-)